MEGRITASSPIRHIPDRLGQTAAGMLAYSVRNSVGQLIARPGIALGAAASRLAALARRGRSHARRPQAGFAIMRSMQCLVLVGLHLALLTPAHAFDGTPARNEQITPEKMTASEALRLGAKKYYAGDKRAAVDSLRYAAENGQPMAAWKLGRMYAEGDGVTEDDVKAFEYYSQVVNLHGEDSPSSPQAPFVASAFVALGNYYLNGIKNSAIKANPGRARQIFTHAASYYGDAEAQFALGRLYRDNNELLAVRWFNLAAIKGHVGAQALLGETLFNLGDAEGNRERGLMWLTIARSHAGLEAETRWIVDLQERYFALADEDVRRTAAKHAEAWIARNGVTTATAATSLQLQ